MLERKSAIRTYRREDYPIADEVALLFAPLPLELLHQHPEGWDVARLAVGKDQHTFFHQRFYQAFLGGGRLRELYERFMRDVVLDHDDESGEVFLYQSVPTFRVQLPGNVATGGFHRDRDYNHPDQELNFVLPCTRMLAGRVDAPNGSSIYIEVPGKAGAFVNPSLKIGDLLRFDGANLLHGSKPNDTLFTRVSLDFRIIREVDLPAECGKRSIAHGVPFEVGGYYSRTNHGS